MSKKSNRRPHRPVRSPRLSAARTLLEAAIAQEPAFHAEMERRAGEAKVAGAAKNLDSMGFCVPPGAVYGPGLLVPRSAAR